MATDKLKSSTAFVAYNEIKKTIQFLTLEVVRQMIIISCLINDHTLLEI